MYVSIGYIYVIMPTRHASFEWDEMKARSNEAKHGVSFDNAAAALMFDPFAVEEDDDHDEYEIRTATLVLGAQGLLFVVWTEPIETPGMTRIITARQADNYERARYVRANQ